MVLQNHSKTNQFNNKEMVTPMVSNPVEELCPVHHMKELFTRFDLASNLPAFSYIENG